jgi:hypothetical protein
MTEVFITTSAKNIINSIYGSIREFALKYDVTNVTGNYSTTISLQPKSVIIVITLGDTVGMAIYPDRTYWIVRGEGIDVL